MHTIYVMTAGLLLLGVSVLFAHALAGSARARYALAFNPVWFACAAYTLWIGVTRAGYSFAEELPVFLLVFAVPALVALWLSRRFARSAP